MSSRFQPCSLSEFQGVLRNPWPVVSWPRVAHAAKRPGDRILAHHTIGLRTAKASLSDEYEQNVKRNP